MKRCLRAALAALASVTFGGAACAWTPAHPVTLSVGFVPGGGTDTTARIVAKKLSENIHQSVVVENRPGAGGNIAAQAIATAAPDGYQIHLSSVGPLTVSPHMMKVPYDVKRDFAPITLGVVFPNVIVVPASSPAKTLADFVAMAKKDDIAYASSGIGGAAHLAGELLAQRAGIHMVHVPYKGGGAAMTDVLGGRVAMYPAVPSTAVPHIEAGKLRALAVTGPDRLPNLPNVPTVAESGYPGFAAENWYAFVAPAKTPKDIIDFWNRELVKALKDPEVVQALDKQGLSPHPGTPEDLAKYIDSESEKWAKVVKAAHITAE